MDLEQEDTKGWLIDQY
nr:hypothetical protein [Tanacetum cinerariifolium]